jgi:hypothetical protein
MHLRARIASKKDFVLKESLAGRRPWYQEEDGQWTKHRLQTQQNRKSR